MTAPTMYRAQQQSDAIDLDLSKNEGRSWAFPSGPIEVDNSLIRRYPDVDGLRNVIAEMHGLAPESVMVTAGGDDALARCFLSAQGERVTSTTPTFEMITRYAEQVGSELDQVPWWSGPFPTDAFVDSARRSAVAVVVSPNNPTGSVIDRVDLARVAEVSPLVVLDAAYAEFADEDVTEAALEFDNVVVVRTLSKAYGLAGLRVGYALGPAPLLARMSAFGSPYAVSAPSADIAVRALDSPREGMRAFVERIRGERAELTSLLSELSAGPLESQANFVLATDVEPEWLLPAAESLGISLRSFPGEAALERCVRITLPGQPGDFDRLRQALRASLAPQAILFDLDGVIADVSQSYDVAIIETAASFGVEVTLGDIAEQRLSGDANDDWELTKRLCEAKEVSIPIDRVIERFQALYLGSEDRAGLNERESMLVDKALMERLSETIPLALVTGRPRTEAVEFLDRFELSELFGAVVTRDEAPLKPDPAPVRLALEVLGVSSAWMLGDTTDDMRAARAAGVVPIGIAADGSPPAGAALTLQTAGQIEEVLNEQVS